MRSLKAERGAVNFGLIAWILIAVFLVYEAKQFGPLLFAQFEFQDAVVEAAKFSATKTADAVQNEVLAKANELSLPVTKEMIKVFRKGTSTRIQVSYVLAAEWLPGKRYSWTVNVDEESSIF